MAGSAEEIMINGEWLIVNDAGSLSKYLIFNYQCSIFNREVV